MLILLTACTLSPLVEVTTPAGPYTLSASPGLAAAGLFLVLLGVAAWAGRARKR